MNVENFLVPEGKKLNLKSYKTDFTGDYTDKREAIEDLRRNIERLTKLQDVLYAQNQHALLIIFQAMDAAGKDSAIKHVMSGLNPQGVDVTSFKQPSSEELDHDYLWRSMKQLPERGRIGIFNRSYYEEVLVVRVHPEILQFQQMPDKLENDKNIWKKRFEQIRNFENYLSENGIYVLKFFLNVSKEEQKKRFLKRINTPEKNWKFSAADVKERGFWDDYMQAYEDALQNTSTRNAPWFVVPADNKWFTRVAVSEIVINKMESLDLKYPTVSEAHMQNLLEAKKLLESEQ
ncbi:MAG: polyphosphate kinase 2 family protein [Acidobacteria bacterium]|nr:polyphosphate kinase 2 family protein [Acidobacteriota bacterium]MCA1639752.1 polyphosphate kinase 2 family protein [Acidobacteriota bacterium]